MQEVTRSSKRQRYMQQSRGTGKGRVPMLRMAAEGTCGKRVTVQTEQGNARQGKQGELSYASLVR